MRKKPDINTYTIYPNGPMVRMGDTASLRRMLECAAGNMLTIPTDKRALDWTRTGIAAINAGASLLRTEVLLAQQALKEKDAKKSGRAKPAAKRRKS